jgi:hypothetical protein
MDVGVASEDFFELRLRAPIEGVILGYIRKKEEISKT